MKDGTDLSFDAETVAGGGGLSGADLFAAGVGGVGRRWRRRWARIEVMKVLLTAVEGISRRGLRGEVVSLIRGGLARTEGGGWRRLMVSTLLG